MVWGGIIGSLKREGRFPVKVANSEEILGLSSGCYLLGTWKGVLCARAQQEDRLGQEIGC